MKNFNADAPPHLVMKALEVTSLQLQNEPGKQPLMFQQKSLLESLIIPLLESSKNVTLRCVSLS